MNWTKSVTWVALVCACVSVATIGAWAQGNDAAPRGANGAAGNATTDACPTFVDADGDGICDNKGQTCAGKDRGNGQGGCGSGNGSCQRNQRCGGRG